MGSDGESNLSDISETTESSCSQAPNTSTQNIQTNTRDFSSQSTRNDEVDGRGDDEDDDPEDDEDNDAEDSIKLPDWVNRLKDYFEFICQHQIMEKKTSRLRNIYTLKCIICKKKNLEEQKTSRPKGRKLKKTVCDGIIKGKSSHAFKRHLECLHPDEHDSKVFARIPKTVSSRRGDKSQETIATSVIGKTASSSKNTHLKPYDSKSAKMKEFQIGVLDMITLESLPLSFTDSEGFRTLIAIIDSRLTCPSRRTLGRLLDQKFNTVTDHIRECVRDLKAGSAHLLLDMWTSRQNVSVIGIQIRFIWKWEVKQILLGFRHFQGPHDAKSIRKKLEDLLVTEFQLPLHHFATVTADNASAILNAFKLQYNDDDISSAATQDKNLIEADKPANTSTVDAGEEESQWEEMFETEINFEKDLTYDPRIEAAVLEAITIVPECHQESQHIIRNSCLAHLLQLGIRDAMKGKFICDLAKKFNSIVTWFHKSSKFNDMFQELSGLALVKPIDTRWNSLYHCLKRFCRHGKGKSKKQLAVICNDVMKDARKQARTNKKIPASITDDELAAAEVVVELLEPFASLTNDWQADNVTSSLVLMSFLNALQVLQETKIHDMLEHSAELSDFKYELKRCIIERFSLDKSRGQKACNKEGRERRIVTVDIFHDPAYIMATLLDPRIKTLPFEKFKDPGLRNGIFSKEDAIEILKHHVENERKLYPDIIDVTPSPSLADNNRQSQSSSTQERPPSHPPAKKPRSMWAMIDDDTNTSSQAAAEIDEVDLYLNVSKSLLPTDNPLSFWKQNADRLPTLTTLAKKYLSMPATSASVERLFSTAGSVIRCRRARLRISTAEKLLCYQDFLRNGL